MISISLYLCAAIYLLNGAKDHQPSKELVLDKMAQTVSVKGRLVKMGGLQAVYVDTVTTKSASGSK